MGVLPHSTLGSTGWGTNPGTSPLSVLLRYLPPLAYYPGTTPSRTNLGTRVLPPSRTNLGTQAVPHPVLLGPWVPR